MRKDIMGQMHHTKPRVIVFVLGFLAGGAFLRRLPVVAALMVGGLGVSLIPAYVFVPATHVMYDYAPYYYMCYLAIPAIAGAALSALATVRISPSRTQPAMAA
jgi:hypothetical protein